MEKFTKIICKRKVNVLAEKELQPQAESLFLVLENIGAEIEDKFIFQVGWSLYFLEYKDDEFYIISPDFTKNPFKEKTKDLTLALWVQLEQTHLLRKVNRSGESVRFDDKIIALKGVINQKNIYLQRTNDDIEKGDSGWYIGSLDDSDISEEYEAFYTYELLKLRPSLMQILALPFDYMVTFEKDKLQSIVDENNNDIWNA